ncbi:unnamed protein product [Echinostoma caproni]|uniref:CARD domain-containing protein n=1 Tax=Echinostoma caproni TaxID=27848 RepID=A0A183B5B5_9TREM|nr:unnamed protein product [Echinostoma caproni]
MVAEVVDVVSELLEDGPLEALRDAILERTESFNKERIRRVLHDMSLDDHKPSRLYRPMRKEMGNILHDNAFAKEL